MQFKMKRLRFSRLSGYAVCVFVIFLALLPLTWMLLASFKNDAEVYAVPLKFFPTKWMVSNYQRVITIEFGKSFITTLEVTLPAVALSLAINTMAGYVFARLDFYGKKLLWVYCLIGMFVPGITTQLTSFLVVNKLRMLDTYWVLLLPGLANSGTIFFYRQFYLNIPNSLEDAARIDGCGRFRTYASIFLPMLKGPLVVTGMGCFMGYWNSYMWQALTIPSGSRWQQVQQVIRNYNSVYASEYGMTMAATCLSLIPPIILFMVFQKYITKGYVLSGVK